MGLGSRCGIRGSIGVRLTRHGKPVVDPQIFPLSEGSFVQGGGYQDRDSFRGGRVDHGFGLWSLGRD